MSLSDKALRLVQDEFQAVQSQQQRQQQQGQRQGQTSASEVSTDVGTRAHNAAVAHIEACLEALDSEGEGEDEGIEVATMAPFCGCTDCIVREVLFVAYPILTGKDFEESPQLHG